MARIFAHRYAIFAVTLSLLILCTWASTYRITETPPIWYDEGIYSQTAQHFFAHQGLPVVQTAPGVFESAWNSSGGFPFIMPIALSYTLFGDSVASGRALMAFFMLSLVLLAAALVWKLFGVRPALWALALLTSFPILYATGKSVLGEVPGLLYLCLFLLLLVYIERKNFTAPWWMFFLAGGAAGLAAVTKPIFLLVPVAVALVALLRVRHIPWRVYWVLPAVVGGLLPLVIHYSLHISGAPAGVLASYYSNPYNVADPLGQMVQNVLRFATEATPLHVGILFALWAASVLWRALQRMPISLAERVAFTVAALVLIAYTRTVGWYRYFFIADILSLIFAPASVYILAAAVAQKFSWAWRIAPLLGTCALTLLFALQLYSLFFNSWVADYAGSTRTQQIAAELSALKPQSIAFLDVPELVVLSPTQHYYQQQFPAPGFEVGAETLLEVKRGIPEVVVLREDNRQVYAPYLERYVLRYEDTAYDVLVRK